MADEFIEREYGWGSGCFIHFDGNYGREGLIEAAQCVCHGCGKTAPCIATDASEGEYTAGAVCGECIEKLFAGLVPSHAKGSD